MPKLLLVGLVEQTCRKTIVREVPGVADCFPVKEDKKETYEKVCATPIYQHGMADWRLIDCHERI